VCQLGLHTCRARLVDAFELVIAALARECPRLWEQIVVIDCSAVAMAGAREMVERAGAGLSGRGDRGRRRLRLLPAPLPVALHGGEPVIGATDDVGRRFASDVAALAATLVRARREDPPQTLPPTAMLRQRIESISWTANDLLERERRRARTPARPARPHRSAAARPDRLRRPQPLARTPRSRPGQLHRATSTRNH
jgi:hypothetical protein